jgi:hypothetical protein
LSRTVLGVFTDPLPINRLPIVASVGSRGNMFTESLPSNESVGHSTNFSEQLLTCSGFKSKTVSSSETLAPLCQTKRCYNTKDHNMNLYHCDNVKTNIIVRILVFVGIATGYWLDSGGFGVRVPVGARLVSSSRFPNRFWRPTRPPIQWKWLVFPRG